MVHPFLREFAIPFYEKFLHHVFICGPTWVRTKDLPVMSRWLFQLSYGPDFSNKLNDFLGVCQ